MRAQSRGLLDTSALVLIESLQAFPVGWAWSACSLSYAELAWGVARATGDKRARRERLVGLVRATFGAGLPFDDLCATHFGYLWHLTEQAGRRPRGRTTDLLIAAVAARHDAVLVTANVDDVLHLAPVVRILHVYGDGTAGTLHDQPRT